ncbi:MAG: TIGR02117 family protein [Pseudomonadota bacterium]|nr:TIGR02117 family protein [Pseudomonadota bacterium]
MRYQAALRPDYAVVKDGEAHLGRRMGEGKTKRRRTKRRRRSPGSPARRILTAVLAIPAAYLIAALIGSLVPVNRGWEEPDEGIIVYLADNGIHADIVMPARAAGLDWAPLVPKSDVAVPVANARWVAVGSGEERVYLDTPTWWDIRPRTIWAALTGGRRVNHVEWVESPSYAAREIRLRPEEYRRLWAAVRADFELSPDRKPVRVDHPGYGCCDAFYWGGGRFSALSTCNTWAADKLRLAGVKTSLWPPFVQGLVWRYRNSSPARGGGSPKD